MATDNYTVSNSGGLISILREFSRSVEKLSQTVLFPVRLQDLEVIMKNNDDELSEIVTHCFNEKTNEANMYELYVLLRDTRSELLSGNEASKMSATTNTRFHKDLRRMMRMLKLLTELSDTVRLSYEKSIAPCRPT